MSISEKYIAELYNKIQEERPIIHCITNAVTVNDCANILLAAGASPTMAHHPLEVEEITAGTKALVCNFGAIADYEAMEKAKRETLKQEQESKFLESIINVEFDANDKDAIVKTLTSLSSYVDMWIKDSSKNANVARSKFDTGLAMLSAVDASNPMITYFTNKKLEWSNYENKKRKTQLITAGIAIVVLLIIIVIGLAQS